MHAAATTIDRRDGRSDDHLLSDVGYHTRPVEHRLGARPTWQHAAFADLFASAYTSERAKRPPPLLSLVVSMELLQRAAALLAKECVDGSAAATGVGRAVRALDAAQAIVTSVPEAITLID